MVNIRAVETEGRVCAVHGNVVDVRFDTELPPRQSHLTIDSEVSLEIQSHLNESTVRTIALTPTSGVKQASSYTVPARH